MDQTLFLIIIDESLSMRTKRQDVIDGINNYLDVQKQINPNGRLILIKFNNNVTVVHKAIDIQSVNPLKLSDYQPSGRTCLFDAIHHGLDLTNQLRIADKERVCCIIITDGEDNASIKNQSCKDIQKLLRKYESKDDWSFTYLGGKSFEYWTRKKPQSKICYNTNFRPKLPNDNNRSVFEQRRYLRQQQQLHHQQSMVLS